MRHLQINLLIESIKNDKDKCNTENRYFEHIEIMEKYWISIDSISLIPFIAKLMIRNWCLFQINLHKYVSIKKKNHQKQIGYQQFCFMNLRNKFLCKYIYWNGSFEKIFLRFIVKLFSPNIISISAGYIKKTKTEYIK